MLLKGHFSVDGYGYIQLCGNKLSGELTPRTSKMQNLGMIHLDENSFYGELPLEIEELPLSILSISKNMFTGEIPREFGKLEVLRSLDLSYNNLSGSIPREIGELKVLRSLNLSFNNFSGNIPDSIWSVYNLNVSYNQYISGTLPSEEAHSASSYLGDPLLINPVSRENRSRNSTPVLYGRGEGKMQLARDAR